MPRVLLLSAYHATSHRLWCERLQALLPEFQWTVLTLPPRNFNWTIRGNSLLWAFRENELLQQDYDLIVATSMVDLSSLRGFMPALAHVPTVLYFHENQFAYPVGAQRSDNVEPQLVPLYAALCADRIVFNSHYNRDSFLAGAQQLLQKLPDALPATIISRLQASQVIPVPVPMPQGPRPAPTSGNTLLEVIWNHRWEYDKGIDLLLALCTLIHDESLPVRLHIAGEQFRQAPGEFKLIEKLLQEHADALHCPRGQFGFMQGRREYEALLQTCDVVLSTARHDFQGLAIQEACMAGCTPLAPRNLAYPEYLHARHLYAVGVNASDTAAGLCGQLQRWQSDKAAGIKLPKQNLAAYTEAELRPRYAALFTELLK